MLDLQTLLYTGSQERLIILRLYQGKGTSISPEHKTLRLGGLIAMRLSNIISRKQNLKLFFDNCFTNIELIKIRLRKENGIYISFWCCETLSHGRLR